jgi:hypothetical protein
VRGASAGGGGQRRGKGGKGSEAERRTLPHPHPSFLPAAIGQQVRGYVAPDATPLLPPTDHELLFGPLPGLPATSGGVGGGVSDELEVARLRWAMDGDPRSPYPMALPPKKADGGEVGPATAATSAAASVGKS